MSVDVHHERVYSACNRYSTPSLVYSPVRPEWALLRSLWLLSKELLGNLAESNF
jgi:hypothetical protein